MPPVVGAAAPRPCSGVQKWRVSLDEVRSCKQDILTISSYSHKTEDRTQLVIVRQTVLCLVTSRFASTTRTLEGVNGIETLNLQVCVCVLTPHPHECRGGHASTSQTAEMMSSWRDGLLGLFALKALAWHAQPWNHKA